MSSISGLLNGRTVETLEFECGICGKRKQCWPSNDVHNTYAVCQQCAKENDMEHCGYCGDMRFPENLDRPDPKYFRGRGGYCPGCFDEAIYIIEHGKEERKIKPKTTKTVKVRKDSKRKVIRRGAKK